MSEDERASEPGNRVDLQFKTTQGRRQVRKQLSPARRQRRDHAAMPAPHGADGPDGDPRCSGRRDDQPAHFGERTPVGDLAPGQHPSHAVPLQSGLILEGKKRTSRGVGNGRPRALLAVHPLCLQSRGRHGRPLPPGSCKTGPAGLQNRAVKTGVKPPVRESVRGVSPFASAARVPLTGPAREPATPSASAPVPPRWCPRVRSPPPRGEKPVDRLRGLHYNSDVSVRV